MIMLSIASRQVWPHILLTLHFKPRRLILLHSENLRESEGPAKRLRQFWKDTGFLDADAVRLIRISDSDFGEVERKLDHVQLSESLPLDECVLNFTGGNKLMATAAFRWAARRGLPAMYLERRFQVTRFEPRDGDMVSSTEMIDAHIADSVDPLHIVRAHLEESSLADDGQAIELSEEARRLPDEKFWRSLPSADMMLLNRWLVIDGTTEPEKEGDRLELIVAAALLKLGAVVVRRSVRLKAARPLADGAGSPHQEVDLICNYGGRLWVFDCKDREPIEEMAEGLEKMLVKRMRGDGEWKKLWNRIKKQVVVSDTKVIKEDLFATREMAGLLGETVCVRRRAVGEEVQRFARQHGIHLIEDCRRGENLRRGLRRLLEGDEPGDSEHIGQLARG